MVQARQVVDEPDIPVCVEHVWRWFIDLASSESVSYTEIRAWSELTGNNPSPAEINMLRLMCRVRQEAPHES